MQRFQVHSHSQALTPTHRSLQPVASIGVQTTQPFINVEPVYFSSRSTSPVELDNIKIDTPPQTTNMASGNKEGDDDDYISHHRNYYSSLRDITKFEGKGEGKG